MMRFSAMGDIAMLVPVVYSLATEYPDLRISVVSRPFARTFFDGLAPNVDFMEADVKREYNGIKGLNTLFRRLIAKHPTAVADMHDVLRTKYLRLRFTLGGWKVKHINKHRREKKRLCDYNNKVRVQLPTSFQNYADVLDRLGYPIQISFTSIFKETPTPPEIIGNKNKNEQWIGIAPFAAHEGKIYPVNRMEEVIRQITTQRPNSRIFLFGGGKKETEQFDKWCKKYSQCMNASAALGNMNKELQLMANLDCMVSMDSANMHLASLTGCPVVSIWGATHPYAGFLGWNQKKENIIQTDIECRPCSIYGNKPCLRGDMACMYNIQPTTIAEKIIQVIDSK
jgi:ADP-heptose:LPS heptosyltransferase